MIGDTKVPPTITNSPVRCVPIDWERDYSAFSVRTLLGMSDDALAYVDPLAVNLIVAREIPALAALDLRRYQTLANAWACDLAAQLPTVEQEFFDRPGDWHDDLDFFRLGLVATYCDLTLRVAYKEDQRNLRRIRYTDPTDLFLCGVMDTRRGTCGNLAMLQVALGRRLGYPVSLACVGSHFLLRFDDGAKQINIETTDTGRGGFASPDDGEILGQGRIPWRAVECGSDLRAVTPREMLGLFLGLRARHYENTDRFPAAESDYLQARALFPNNRQLYYSQNQISVQNSMELFLPGERGHPTELAEWLQDVVRIAPWTLKRKRGDEFDRPQPTIAGTVSDSYLEPEWYVEPDWLDQVEYYTPPNQ